MFGVKLVLVPFGVRVRMWHIFCLRSVSQLSLEKHKKCRQGKNRKVAIKDDAILPALCSYQTTELDPVTTLTLVGLLVALHRRVLPQLKSLRPEWPWACLFRRRS